MPNQDRRRLAAQRIHDDPTLSGPTPVGLKWSPDGTRITYLKPKPGQHAPLVRTEELVPPDQIEVSEQEAARRERMRARQTGIVQYPWSKANRNGSSDRLLFPRSGALWVAGVEACGARALDEHRDDDAALKAAFRDRIESWTELGVFRGQAEGTVRLRGGARPGSRRVIRYNRPSRRSLRP